MGIDINKFDIMLINVSIKINSSLIKLSRVKLISKNLIKMIKFINFINDFDINVSIDNFINAILIEY